MHVNEDNSNNKFYAETNQVFKYTTHIPHRQCYKKQNICCLRYLHKINRQAYRLTSIKCPNKLVANICFRPSSVVSSVCLSNPSPVANMCTQRLQRATIQQILTNIPKTRTLPRYYAACCNKCSLWYVQNNTKISEKLTRKTAVSKSCSSQLLYPALFLRSETSSQYDGI